ncbi:MAG TPA: hypothetical protein DCK98_01120 [Chloroflexi bacterium]|nr:hypothetical protein [Chloroflexota bacterium]HAL27550.1 hypothetical protein [Chloroflexota bacterium]
MTGLPPVLDSRGLELIGHTDLLGKGDGMQIMKNGDVLYVGHMGDFGVGTSVVDVSDLRGPRVVTQLAAPARTHAHKTQYADGLLLVNNERYPYDATDPESTGIVVYDVSRAESPKRIGFLHVPGFGVHRLWWTGGRFAYASARGRPGVHGASLVTVDLSDPEQPLLHAEWCFPEQRRDDADPGIRAPRRYPSCHHAIVRGDRAYAGWFDAGVAIFAVADGRLSLIGQVDWTARAGGHPYTHTALPLGDRGLVIATDEAIDPDRTGAPKDIHVVDMSVETAPRELVTFPVPEDRPTRGLRFGPHNLHENRPGTFQSDTIVYATYFSAGLRVYDTKDPRAPVEIARFVPDAPRGQAVIQLNDVLVDADRTVFVTDRHHGGLYILRPTA